ncbi:methyltransferase domain-containing protein [Kitasatospora sp. NPDC001539]|uniref:class I SAM-dependent methyltransferase n=1 Tax=unclassified Kitasatospora TaxID=2633591 RepID=UPI003332506D
MNLRTALGRSGVRWGLTAAAAGTAALSWWAFDSAPYPYAQRWLLDLPLPLLSQERLDAMLELRQGERVLEVGPGTGLQALRTAPQLGPGGRLDIVDVQQEMLDHVMGRAAQRGLGNITPTQADAHHLPFGNAVFDAAYLVTALGEIPQPEVTLRELSRVVKPSGRIVVGEFFDRHQVRRTALARHANAAGLHVTRLIGPPFSYYARLAPCRSSGARTPLITSDTEHYATV